MKITAETWRRVRFGFYVSATAAGVGWTAYMANGDWRDAVVPALGTISSALAAGFTIPRKEG